MAAKKRKQQGYAEKLAADNERLLAKSRAGRDIVDGYPRGGNRRRRVACEHNLELFLRTYFAPVFSLPWSIDHPKVIAKSQACILDGGLFAEAMPRGSGKTAIAVRAALWAALYRHRRFVCLLGSTGSAAEALLAQIKSELLCNELLAADFRAVVYPILRLENNARKAVGQLFEGERTSIVWGRRRLTFPTMPDSACDGLNVSGSTITALGLTGALRGQSHSLASGEVIRPDLVIPDDPQTRESAMSPSQSAERAAIITGDVLGMAGPGKKIAAIMPCTVIREGDMADQTLDPERNPQWQGERTKAVYAWPTAEKEWETYHRIRADGLRHGDGGKAATEFYRANRQAMDRGAVVAWPERFHSDELSAVQHVQNLRADLGEEAFQAEYQNDPVKAAAGELSLLTALEIAAKVNGVKRLLAPIKATQLTCFIDVHDTLLYWSLCAWGPGFDGWVIDYGAYPRQPRRIFTMRKATRTLSTAAPGAGREAAIRAGLEALTSELLGAEYRREDGAGMRIGRCLIDAGYVPDVVYEFCSRSAHAALLIPSRGLGITAAKTPIAEWAKKPGEEHGRNWVLGRVPSRHLRHVKFDAHYWKSFVHARLAVKVGDPAGLSLYGRQQAEHALISEHLVSEAPTRVSANGRTVDEWSIRPGKSDNHWLDCVVGCAVGASLLKVALPEMAGENRPRKRMTFAEMQARSRDKKARAAA